VLEGFQFICRVHKIMKPSTVYTTRLKTHTNKQTNKQTRDVNKFVWNVVRLVLAFSESATNNKTFKLLYLQYQSTAVPLN